MVYGVPLEAGRVTGRQEGTRNPCSCQQPVRRPLPFGFAAANLIGLAVLKLRLTQDSGGLGTSQNPYLFKAGIQDCTTGWVKFGQRWYNPNVGRWTQQDTLDAPLDPANANRYAFAANDPINNSDPTGAFGVAYGRGACLGICIGASIGGDHTGPAFNLSIGIGIEAGANFQAGFITGTYDALGTDLQCSGSAGVRWPLWIIWYKYRRRVRDSDARS